MSDTIWLSKIPIKLLLYSSSRIALFKSLACSFYFFGDIASRIPFSFIYRTYQNAIGKSIEYDDLALKQSDNLEEFIEKMINLTDRVLTQSTGDFECNYSIVKKRIDRLKYIKCIFLKYFKYSRIWKEVE